MGKNESKYGSRGFIEGDSNSAHTPPPHDEDTSSMLARLMWRRTESYFFVNFFELVTSFGRVLDLCAGLLAGVACDEVLGWFSTRDDALDERACGRGMLD